MTKKIVYTTVAIVVLALCSLGISPVVAQADGPNDITEIVWSNSGRYLAYGTYGGMIYVRDTTTQQIITTINAFGEAEPELVGKMAWDATDNGWLLLATSAK